MPDRLIIQISDTHVVEEGRLLHDKVDSYANLEAIFTSIENAERKPDAVLLTGDLTDHGHAHEYERLRSLVVPFADRIGVPVVLTPGNHDDREQFRTSLMEGKGTGPIDQVVWAGGLRLIALDSTVPGHHHGELSDEQLEFLDNELDETASEGTIIALHHPPVPSPLRVVNMLGLHEPEKLARVIEDRGVVMLLAGHAHHATAGMFAGAPVWVATATAYQADLLAPSDLMRGIPGSGYTRIDVADGKAFASQVATAFGQAPIYEFPLAALEEHIAALAASK